MAHWFDDLAVSVGQPDASRRTALRKAGAGFAGALALLMFGGGRADASEDKADDDKKKCHDPGLLRCGSTCVVPAIDPDNCGGCGITCTGGQICRKGVCVTQCPPVTCNATGCPSGTVSCNGTCVNLASDSHNCGACGHTCPSGATCVSGVCACPAGTVNCGGACVNVASDPANCGSCGHACPTGQTCSQGVCTGNCPAGTVSCNGTCVNVATDPANCGACGVACPSGATCVSGVCACPAGTTNCNGACINTSTDVNNCGGCNTRCIAANGTATCVNGTCQVASCNAGFANCDGIGANGCETNTMTDVNNCGGCNTRCIAANGTPSCVNGTCQVASCNAGFVNCDGIGANGCECAGTGCCGSGCQTVHSNGLGQNYYDCTALATYNATQAQEAAFAATAVSGAPQLATCAGGAQVVTRGSITGTCATWAYTGTATGHVLLSNSGCVCPTVTDPIWT